MGSDSEEGKPRHKHRRHSKHKHSSSHGHRNKHKHEKSHHHKHHHHHKRSHKKHRRRERGVRLDEQVLQTALESLEAEALEAVRVKASGQELRPEAIDLLVTGSEGEGRGGGSGSEDSDSSTSDSEQEEKEPQDKGNSSAIISVNGGDSVIIVSSSESMPIMVDSASDVQKSDSSNLELDLETNVKLESQSESHSKDEAVLELESEPEAKGLSSVEDADTSNSPFDVPKTLKAPKSKTKTIRINIQRRGVPGKEPRPTNSTSAPKNESSQEAETSKSELGVTRSVTSGNSKVIYVNLKTKHVDVGKGEEINGSGKERSFGKDPTADGEADGADESERSHEDFSSSKKKHVHASTRSRSQSESGSRKRRKSSRSRSRSRRSHHSRSSSRKRHHSRSKSRGRRHSRSKSRGRRHSRSKSRGRHHSRSRSRKRCHSRASSRRRRSRSRYHSYHKSRYSRSHSRDRHSHSPFSRGTRPLRRSRRMRKGTWREERIRHYSRPRSRSRNRSHSRSRSYSRSRSRSRPKSRSTSLERSRDKTESASKTTILSSTTPGSVIPTVTSSGTKPTGSKKDHIAQLTALCQTLQEKQAIEDNMSPEELMANQEPEVEIRAPFQVKPTPVYQPGLVFHNNAWKTPNQVVVETEASRSVEQQFPVSTGLHHQTTEGETDAQREAQAINVFAKFQESFCPWKAYVNSDPKSVSCMQEQLVEEFRLPEFLLGRLRRIQVSVGDLVVKRLEMSRRLQDNPSDLEAWHTLNYIERQTKVWAESQLKPGQFTGQATLTPLSREEHNTGMQAWAKKDMFRGLAPVMKGFGLKMMMKMGWRLGQPLGKKGEGFLEPITMDVKVNRSGLSTEMDKQAPIVPASALQATDSKSAHLVQGKHPVSALQEICAKKKWNQPVYELIDCVGSAHKKTFLYRVSVPLGAFQPAVASSNKKQAKAQAALACLQGLGFISNSLEYSAS